MPCADGDHTRGWRRHWRRGVYGFLAAWAAGSLGVVIFILAECAVHFDVVAAVGQKLGLVLSTEEVKQAEVDAYIVERIKAVLHVLKNCQSEQARIEYGIILAALAPVRLAERSRGGMIRKVAERIGVQRGTRSYKSAYYDGRFKRELEPRPFSAAISRRDEFDKLAQRTGLLGVGEAAVATSSCVPCTVVEIDHENKTCLLEFEAEGGVKRMQAFSSLDSGPGGARLHRAAPSLRPGPRSQRGDEKAEKARPKVEELFNAEGATSPSMRDQVRRRVGLGLFETAQALVVYAKRSALYALYLARYPAHKISFSLFKKLAPWNVRRAKQQMCQCQTCTNFKGYQRVLASLPKLFEAVTHPPQQVDVAACADAVDSDGETDGNADPDPTAASWDGEVELAALLAFCSREFKSEMVKAVLCDGVLDLASSQPSAAGDAAHPSTRKALACLNGKCSCCGFKRLWSNGLRKKLVERRVNGQGVLVDDLKPNVPIEFQSKLTWTRISSSKGKAAGADKELMHEPRSGTVIEFLDEFEREAMAKFPFHKFTIIRQKATAAEFARNRCPGWLQFDVDFAENGSIITAEEVQSQYWKINSFTLFVQVSQVAA